jgi:hypothetical protein
MPKVKRQIEEIKEFGKMLVIKPIKPQAYLENMIDLTMRKDEE